MEISKLAKQPSPKISNTAIAGQDSVAVTDRDAAGTNS
jgi:hypothetical protein